jgi:hypothetical protein
MAQRELARKEEAYAQKMMNITTGGNLVEESQIQHQPQRQATGAGGPLFSIGIFAIVLRQIFGFMSSAIRS